MGVSYTGHVKSVADRVRAATRANVLAMSPEERLELAFTLGDEDVRSLAEARGVDLLTARRIIRRQRQAGRRPCRCLDERV